MPRKFGLLVVVGLIVAAAPLPNDNYPIKIKKSAQGDVIRLDREETDDSSFKREEPDGKVSNERKERTVLQSYKETIVAKEEGKRAVKLRREYTKAIVKTGDKETVLACQGKTVLIEKKDGKYHFAFEDGKELTGNDAELLNREFNKGGDDGDDADMEKAFLPAKPVKAGEPWKIEPAVITKAFEKGASQPLPMDKENVKGEGKLVRAYKDGDRQYADIDIDINIPLKGEFSLGRGQTAPIGSGSRMVMQVRYKKICIDGATGNRVTDMSFDMNLDTTFKGLDGKEYKFSITNKHTLKNKREELSKK